MYKEYNPHQDFLLPPSVEELLPKDDLSRLVVEVVSRFDVSPFRYRYKSLGPHAYHPKMMLALLFYAYSQGVFSSRKIEERIRFDVRFMYVAGFHHPDFRTICNFRKNNIDLIAGYFKDIVLLCAKIGMATLHTVAIDGSKFKANASNERNRDKKTLAREIADVESDIRRCLAFAHVADNSESGTEDRTDKAKFNKLNAKRAKLEIASKKLAERSKRSSNDVSVNLTDPESRVLAKVGPGYNAQIAVETKNAIIVAADVVDDANDVQQLVPMVDRTVATTDHPRDELTVLADAGYASAEAFTKLDKRRYITAYVPQREDVHFAGKEVPPFHKSQFKLDLKTGTGTCPLGQPMRRLRQKTSRSGQPSVQFVGTACQDCPHKAECTDADKRNVSVPVAEPVLKKMRDLLKTNFGKMAMKIRKSTVEPVFGILKAQLGFRQVSLRGLDNVKGEFLLLCGAYNLKKIGQLLGGLDFCSSLKALETKILAVIVHFSPNFRQILLQIGFFRRVSTFSL